MNENQKEYIEFRLIILGDAKVGKKSFLERLLNITSTNIIRNKELEHQYKKSILKLRKKYEKEKEILDQIKSMNSRRKRREELIKRLLNKSLRKNKPQLDNTNNNKSSESKSPETKENDKTELEEEEPENNKFILRVTSDEQFYSKKYTRPPIPELPGKIFNVNKTKIVVKPFYILPGEKIDFNYNPEIDDSENEYDTEYNVSFKGIKYDVKKIISNKKAIIEEEKLKGYKISIFNIFVLLYDMSNFYTFNMILKYYKFLESTFELSKKDNSIIFLIGNKKDKKALLDSDQVSSLNSFLKQTNFLFYEISTRLYYNFTKFFIDLIIKSLSKFHLNLLEGDNFKLILEKIANNKQSFAKSKREIYQKLDSFVGPKYYVNIYGFNSQKELSESFNIEKMRFNKKIFVNKTGPKYMKSKSTKDMNININETTNENLLKLEQQLYEIKGGLINKPIKGCQFGIVNGKLNLLKLRKKLIYQRNKSLKDSIEEGSSLFTQNTNTFRIKGDEYLAEAKKRRQNIIEKKIKEKKDMAEELNKIHLINLEKIENEKNIKKEKLLASKIKSGQSLSFPDLFTSFSNANNNINYTSNLNTKEKEKEEEMNKTSSLNYIDMKHFKNKEYLKDYYFKLKMIKATHPRDQPTPGPNSYDIRRDISEKNKGFTITGKRKELSQNLSDPSFADLKDEFDIIVLKGKKYKNKVEYSPRFKKLEKEKDRGPYQNEEIWKKWELNKSDINKNKVKYFMENLNEKKKKQLKKIELIKQQNEEINRLRKEILIRKGYEDPSEIKSINYSQVENSSPKYTIKGRHPPKIKLEPPIEEPKTTENISTEQDLKENNININDKEKEKDKFIPSPNINYVKPKLPRVVFGKAERFDTHKEYQGSLDIFQNGVFALKTQQDFSCKSPYDNPVQRTSFQKIKEKSPSPADYVIKSIFEIIAEKGKKTSDIRNKMKIKEMLKNYNSNKNSKKNYTNIHQFKKIKIGEDNKKINANNDIAGEIEKI